ncbi:helix-turn-helix transcriptional regulator [Actinomadura decatromicini]|uniref:Helix-turn-helix transcriptional regulator n=1 Tax=Actinomadura decatromicini TaxID=2604572 RepID=A0A5D3FGF4_9ACTN|nr:helix-turn-helix transcriptional regulator [Actinomadura decatromicini]
MVDSFDGALRAAIQARGLSLERLHVRLAERGIHVSVASLSNWQRGSSRPERSRSLSAVRALEGILEVPPDSLSALLGPRRPRGRWVHQVPGALSYRDVSQVHASVDTLLGQIRNPVDGQLRWLSCDESFRVGSDRDERSVRTRAVFQARVDGVDRHVAVHHCEKGILPDIRRASHCRLGQVRTDPGTGVTAMELLFEKPLRRGDTYVIEYEFGYGGGGPEATFYHRWFRHPTHMYLLHVQFDPDALPVRCHRVWQPNAATPSTDVGELQLSGWCAVHMADMEVRPGVHGIRWEWD